MTMTMMLMQVQRMLMQDDLSLFLQTASAMHLGAAEIQSPIGSPPTRSRARTTVAAPVPWTKTVGSRLIVLSINRI